jgi:hypothetical protein
MVNNLLQSFLRTCRAGQGELLVPDFIVLIKLKALRLEGGDDCLKNRVAQAFFNKDLAGFVFQEIAGVQLRFPKLLIQRQEIGLLFSIGDVFACLDIESEHQDFFRGDVHFPDEKERAVNQGGGFAAACPGGNEDVFFQFRTNRCHLLGLEGIFQGFGFHQRSDIAGPEAGIAGVPSGSDIFGAGKGLGSFVGKLPEEGFLGNLRARFHGSRVGFHIGWKG